MTDMLDEDFYLRAEPACALDPLLLIPRIEYARPIFSYVHGLPGPYTLVILDMISFHLINDVFGYETGDSVLLEFISSVRAALPAGSVTMRFRHGDEFLFFLPLPETQARDFLETLRRRAMETHYPQLALAQDFRVSFRFATMLLDGSHKDHRDLLRMAEARLRATKGQGTARATNKQE